ncbi:MAG: hypothetical protein GKS07_11030 [Nitrosopumilus sp.]|nr:MAG: hypothetical protein GKS07_00595 [Nitrosopumilus sp.]QMU55375.1 MAG: hypothetical protein GKS07_11030 [Nitrosopumilus sp.]
MTSKQNRRQYRVNVYDDTLKEFLNDMTIESKFSDWAKTIFDDLRTGKLTYNRTEKDIDFQIKKLKAAELKLKIWSRVKDSGFSLNQLDALINQDEIPLPENDYPNSKPEPEITKSEPVKNENTQFKSLGSTTMNRAKKILQKDGTLRCKRCNRRFDMRAFDFEQLDDYRNHCEEVHNGLSGDERKELLEIYPE